MMQILTKLLLFGDDVFILIPFFVNIKVLGFNLSFVNIFTICSYDICMVKIFKETKIFQSFMYSLKTIITDNTDNNSR